MKRRTVLGFAAAMAGGITGCTAFQDNDPATDGGAPTMATETATQTMTTTPLVSGTIVFDSARPDLTDATIYVRLEDVSRADTSADIVSEQTLRDPAERGSPDGIPFSLPEGQTDIDSQRRYSVAVHVDMDGDGDVTVGDYISPDLNPVLTRGHPDHVTVTVRKVE